MKNLVLMISYNKFADVTWLETLTEDDYAFILDALYEQAHYQEHCKGGNKVYAKYCRCVAKKFENVFNNIAEVHDATDDELAEMEDLWD